MANASGQSEGVMMDLTYSPTVSTVQLFKKGFELSQPMLELNSADPLILRFDDLQPDPEQLSYTIIHCNAQWYPSDLSPNQYIGGAVTDFVPPANQSFGTLVPYIEYEVEVPNEMMRPTIAGNYIIKVYRGTDQEDVLLTRRFMVFEQLVEINARVSASRDVEMRDIAQQVDLNVRYPGVQVPDPFSDLSITVLQNMRWDDARTGLRPKFLRDNELVYDFPRESLFLGANEWRGINLKNLRYAQPPVQKLVTGPDGSEEAMLMAERNRAIKVYADIPDINGRTLVRNDQVEGDPLSADYVWVNFTLQMDGPVETGAIYVYGAFSDFQCKPELKMVWVPEASAYVLRARIKQGYIDYCYAYMPDGRSVPDLTTLEGSHFQTENDYLVLVYVKDYTLRCDRLVGMRFLNSRRG